MRRKELKTMLNPFNEEKGAIIGTLYQDGIFLNGIHLYLKEGADVIDWKRFLYKNGYVDFFEIGNPEELQINCSFFSGEKKNEEPLYILEIADIQGSHEFYFVDDFLALNDLLKLFSPLLELAQYLEKRSQENEENRSRF